MRGTQQRRRNLHKAWRKRGEGGRDEVKDGEIKGGGGGGGVQGLEEEIQFPMITFVTMQLGSYN